MKQDPVQQDTVSRLSAVDTSTLPADGGDHYNRLIFEKSPYLLQHAENPVDWHPWGEEAFALARREDKPVLVSIGYSTCHWCHVMEHESFENEEVAAVLNRLFVPIKVDREERPDVDNTYMSACQILTGGGGWPLNVFITPDKQPFYAATYMPREARGDMAGITDILERIGNTWQSNRQQLLDSGQRLTESLINLEKGATGNTEGQHLTEEPLEQTYSHFFKTFDKDRGGFGEAPKFPIPHNLSLLLRLGQRLGLENAQTMAMRTLQNIRLSGTYDHIGFGVHRYAVDAHWRVPHFEKMLYDQALLTLAAADAYQTSRDPFFSTMVDEVSEYVLRDLTDEQGGFYSGEDADSEGVEGTFYLWTPQQVEEVLGHEHGTIFSHCYEVSEQGNFEGKNIVRLEMDVNQWAAWFGIEPERLGEVLALGRQMLFTAREERIRPHRDDKILTAWNGLMIAALARAATVLDKEEYLAAACASADFILNNLRRDDGRLLRRYRQGEAAVPGFLDDYAFFCWGLIELYQAGFDSRYLAMALELTADMERLFGDGQGNLFDSAEDAETVLTRSKTIIDGAVPAGNSAAAWNLLRLAALTGDQAMTERGEAAIKTSLAQAARYPTGTSLLYCALDFALGPKDVVVLASDLNGTGMDKMLRALRERFLPRTLVLCADAEDTQLNELTPLLQGKAAIDGQTTAYLCRGETCQAPVTSVDELIAMLEG
ncbi:thioredoxin domain-containing protein [Syntrophotalea acetylenivorans]|uniref:thioredoxin domain-containing protein n=1 Tax=Syntrophotalea acetylenivorans TaxID=1842532 RepID=UPI0009F9C08B|nr:thioredoxin domain-containing protein [Syntrophotalea acetylenivorans]